MAKARCEIVCAGDVMREVIVWMPRLPSIDQTVVLDRPLSSEIGGPAFNVAYYLRMLGHSPCLLTVIGKEDSREVLRQISRAGLSTDSILVGRGSTDAVVSFATSKGHVSAYMREQKLAKGARFLSQTIRHAKVLLVLGSRHRTIRREYARLLGQSKFTLRFFGPGYAIAEYAQRELRVALQLSNVAVFNEYEAAHLQKTLGLKLRRLSEKMACALVVTRGSEGLTILDKGAEHSMSSLSVTTKNLIGAGDAFLAGLVKGMVQGDSIVDAARLGVAVASMAVEVAGIRAKISGSEIVRRSRRVRLLG